MAFKDLKLFLGILAPSYLQVQATFAFVLYCLLEICFHTLILLCFHHQLQKWNKDEVWLIKLLSYGTTIFQNSTLICLGLKMKSIQRMWIIVLNLTLFISSSNLKKLLLNLESMSTPEIMSKNSPESYIVLIKYKRTSKACLLKTTLWGWQILPSF